MLSNWITLLRMPLLIGIVGLLYTANARMRLVAAPLILLLILMDSLDGMLARARGEVSVLGSVLDIAADRTVEYVLWIVFAHLGRIPIVVPLIVLMRGTFVDAVRSVAPRKGLKPFDLMQSQLSKFIVGSPWLRTSYAVIKALAFILLAIVHGLYTRGDPSAIWLWGARLSTWLAVGFCLIRGIPVLVEAPQMLHD
jgi:CDP-diacylglycerol--glycerol-3-phosphate 3-phosphatidyltransferase